MTTGTAMPVPVTEAGENSLPSGALADSSVATLHGTDGNSTVKTIVKSESVLSVDTDQAFQPINKSEDNTAVLEDIKPSLDGGNSSTNDLSPGMEGSTKTTMNINSRSK